MLSSWNDAVIPVLAVGSSVALLWTLLAPDERMRAVRHLPRPQSTLPLIGNTLDLSTYHYDRLHDWIYEQCLIHQGKPWLLQAVGAPPHVIVSSVEAFEDVLKTHFEVFDKGPRMNTIFRDAIGEGIVAVDGEKWKQQRKALTHLFTMRRFRECFTGIIQQHIFEFGEVLQHAATKQDNNGLYPLGEAFQRFAFDTFVHAAFGLKEDALGRLGDSQDESKFFKALTDVTKQLEMRFHVPDFVWQFQRALRIGHERELAEALEVIDRRVYDVVHRTLARAKTDTAHQDFLTLMLEHTREFKDQDNADPKRLAKFLRDQGFTMIFGGKDSTGSSLTWFFIMMGRYPHVLAKIREELKSSFPQLFSDRSYLPSMEEIESGLVYLEAALRETLRLYPLAPLNAKEANRDVTLSDGTPIKKGTRVYIPSYALARMPNVWGDDAAEFRPERWLTDANKLRTFSAFQFVSFHAGPRICLGMRFALFQLKSALAYLLTKFDVELEKPPHEYTYEMAITLSVKGDVKARVTPIKP